MHEPASETRWDAARAEEVADRIASDTAAAWARAFAMHALEQVERSEPTPLALDRRHRGCALPAGLRRRLGRDAGARRSLAWDLVVLPDDEPKPEVELVELEEVAVPLGPGAAREIVGKPLHRALERARIELVEEADPGPHCRIEVSSRVAARTRARSRPRSREGRAPAGSPPSLSTASSSELGALPAPQRLVLGEVVPGEPELLSRRTSNVSATTRLRAMRCISASPSARSRQC